MTGNAPFFDPINPTDEEHGLVGRLNAEKPIAWTRTAKGTAVLPSPALDGVDAWERPR